jgi:hypothetical protein
MNKSAAVFGVVLASCLYALPSHAQTRTWVSGVGDDLNPCSRTAPCKTFAGAISKTAIFGEINFLDSGGFGAVTITKSITIKCEGVIGGVLAAGTTGINVNDSGSATPGSAIVTLSGLDLEGTATGINGINFTSGAILHVHKLQIRGFRGGGSGIVVGGSGAKRLFVADSYITDNGNSVSTAGILVRPTGGGSVNVSINRTQLEGNTNGVFMDGTGGGGASNLSVRDSVLGGSSSNGIAVASTGPAFKALVDNTLINFNAGVGVATAGASATLHIGRSNITQNVTGTFNAGGTLQSFKNNELSLNGTDGPAMTQVTVNGSILN